MERRRRTSDEQADEQGTKRPHTDPCALPADAHQGVGATRRTRIRVPVFSILTPGRVRRKATNESVSAASKTPLIGRFRMVGSSTSIGTVVYRLNSMQMSPTGWRLKTILC